MGSSVIAVDAYRTAIFAHDESQEGAARQSRQDVIGLDLEDRPIDTRIIPFEAFYPAEDYHQDYYQKNPVRLQNTIAGAAAATSGWNPCGGDQAGG